MRNLFEIAVVARITPNESYASKLPELILPPCPVIAVDREAAREKAVLLVDNYDPDKMEVLVRLFFE